MLEDKIVDVIFEKYGELPAKSKPGIDTNGILGWVPMSGIVLLRDENDITCLALATGMKCLPSSKIPEVRGFVLHDWHAEVLAIRGLNHFLIQECRKLAENHDSESRYIRRRSTSELWSSQALQPYVLQESLKIYMYCSEAPCGDASMELIMDAQKDSTPWPIASHSGDNGSETLLKGRGYFSELGIVRRKPSRPDSPSTLSKSCSDKLALKQCTSLLSSLASLLICPEDVYIHKLILPSTEYVRSACERAFGPAGRMKPIAGKKWPGGYRHQAFEVKTTTRIFQHSRRRPGSLGVLPKSSNIATLWTPHVQETLINGVLQGRKYSDPRGGSLVCRAKTSRLVLETLGLLTIPALAHVSPSGRYTALKGVDCLESRRGVKRDAFGVALAGWTRNVEDDFDLFIA